MSILMPQGKDWLVNNWISRAFLADCLPHLAQVPQLADEIRFCVEAEVDTLDLRGENYQNILDLKILVALVIKDNLLLKGQNFHSPDYFSLYLTKIIELDRLVEKIVSPLVQELVTAH